MNITNTTLTKTAEENTANASYHIEYTTVDGSLTRIHALVRTLTADSGEEAELGYIAIEDDNFFCNIHTTSQISPFIQDFEGLVAKIIATEGKISKPANHCIR